MAYTTTSFMPLKMPTPGSREPAQISLINENMVVVSGHDHANGKGVPVATVRSGLAANRPAPSAAGGIYFATDTGIVSLDNGSTWTDFLTSGGSATVTGWTLIDPIIRDTLLFGPEPTGTADTTLQRSAAGDLSLGPKGRLWLEGPDGVNGNRSILSRNPAGQLRWSLDMGNGDTLAGGNAGARLVLSRWADDGSYLGTALLIDRAKGDINLGGNVGVGVAPAAWADNMRAVQVGQQGALIGQADGGITWLAVNHANEAGGDRPIVGGQAAMRLGFLGGGQFLLQTAPSVAAGAAQTFTTRLTVAQDGGLTVNRTAGDAPLGLQQSGVTLWRTGPVTAPGAGLAGADFLWLAHDNSGAAVAGGVPRMQLARTGTLTLTPDAGQDAITFGVNDPIIKSNNSIYIHGVALAGLKTNAQYVALYPAGGGMYPGSHGQMSLGINGQAWTTVWATVGAFNGSHVSLKENIIPLDAGACVGAVLETDWCEFDFKAPPIPDGVTEEERPLYEERIAKEADSRHARGYVLGSPDHQTSGLFGARDRRNQSVTSDLAVVACALQDALRRLAALEANNATA